MYILGVSAFYHDSAAALISDGEIVAAVQEERFTRKKHDPSFPEQAVRYCLQEANLRSINDVDRIVFYEVPALRFERIMETFVDYAPRGFKNFMNVVPQWIDHKYWVEEYIREKLRYSGEVSFVDHHMSHAASAFYPSPFDEAAVLTLDGVGEWATGSWGVGSKNSLELTHEMRYPHSLGLLYSAFTYYLGFKVNSGEYKVMGLAPYGEPKHTSTIYDNFLELFDDGSFELNMKYFDYPTGLTMITSKFEKVFGKPRREPESELTNFHFDVARSIQQVTTDIVLKISKYIRAETELSHLCLAGGVALNSVANGELQRQEVFDKLYIQPAAGDAGGALGAALHEWYCVEDNQRLATERGDQMRGSYFGPEFSDADIGHFLDNHGISYRRFDSIAECCRAVAEKISDGNVVGWFQGRMEYGPRALGSRSILGDPRNTEMQKNLNLKIKYRESFRPFAPSVAAESVHKYFECDEESPYMLLVHPVNSKQLLECKEDKEGLAKLQIERSTLPAITHVDCSARIQTVIKEYNEPFHKLLTTFEETTGVPVLINTSFNVRGEPIVLSPEDAFRCFMNTEMDYLAMGNYLLDKSEQSDYHRDESYIESLEAD